MGSYRLPPACLPCAIARLNRTCFTSPSERSEGDLTKVQLCFLLQVFMTSQRPQMDIVHGLLISLALPGEVVVFLFLDAWTTKPTEQPACQL